MQSLSQTDAVRIGSGEASWVSILPTGLPDLHHGWPAKIVFELPEICGGMNVVLGNVDQFQDDVLRLHQLMQGEATLVSYDPEFSVQLRPVGSVGHLSVTGRLSRDFGEAVSFDINFGFEIDQSYLPTILDGLREHFPRQTAQ